MDKSVHLQNYRASVQCSGACTLLISSFFSYFMLQFLYIYIYQFQKFNCLSDYDSYRLLGFTHSMCVVNGPKKCSVELGEIWTCDILNVAVILHLNVFFEHIYGSTFMGWTWLMTPPSVWACPQQRQPILQFWVLRTELSKEKIYINLCSLGRGPGH